MILPKMNGRTAYIDNVLMMTTIDVGGTGNVRVM